MQEATGNTRKVAEALGWNYNERTQVISRFPIVDPGGADGLYVFVQPTPSTVVAVSNVHLPSTPYGPYRAQAGYTEDQVLDLENRVRLPAIEEQVNELPQLAAMGIPVFLTGDFNSPSYLDWTEEADAARDDMPFPVEWPVSKALADAGFKDSYRAGIRIPSPGPALRGRPGGPESAKHEVHDRIDWVLSTGPATATASSVAGEAGNENVDISIPMWPSDHRSVVSTFRVTPSPTPSFVAAEARSYEQGDEVSVRYHAKPGETVSYDRRAGRRSTPPIRRISRRMVSTASRPTKTLRPANTTSSSSTAAARRSRARRSSSIRPGPRRASRRRKRSTRSASRSRSRGRMRPA